jgi:hypothetical protein
MAGYVYVVRELTLGDGCGAGEQGEDLRRLHFVL